MKSTIRTAVLGLLAGISGQAVAEQPQQSSVHAEKILIAYYSWGGHTRIAAEQIQKATGGTLFEIKPRQAYPTVYRACTEQAKKEIQEGYRPELQAMPENLASYNFIFIGSPNWWSTIAPPVASFLASGNFSGKTVALFVTHGGGGMADCQEAVRKLCPQSKVLPGGAFSGGNIRNLGGEVAEWARQSAAQASSTR